MKTKKIDTDNYSFLGTLKNLKYTMDLAGVRYKPIPILVALGFLMSFTDAISIGLIIPILKGLVEGNFIDSVSTLPVLPDIVALLPAELRSSNTSLFGFLLAVIASASLFRLILRYVVSLYSSYQTLEISHLFRSLMYREVLQLNKSYHDTASIGSILSFINGVTTALAHQITAIVSAINWIVLLIVYLGLMLYLSWKMTVFCLLLFPLQRLFTEKLLKKIRENSEYATEFQQRLSHQTNDSLGCISLVKAYAQVDDEISRNVELSRRASEQNFNMSKKGLLVPIIQDAMILLAMLGFVSFAGFLIAKDASADVASLIVFIILFRRAGPGFSALRSLDTQFQQAYGWSERLLELYRQREEYRMVSGEKNIDSFQTAIEYRNLTFAYPDGKVALDNFSLTIPRGKVVSLVGSSGAGKTTVISLLLRFYNSPENSLFIDGIDIRELSLKSSAKLLSYVGQDTPAFNSSIRENICYGISRKVSDDEIWAVLEQARLKERVEEFPEKLDTVIGERGVILSGGEKQRLAITQAFLRDSPIIILDEATSALDSKTENKIKEAISRLVKNRTVISIAHRLSTIKDADKVVVMERGRVIEEGSPNELLAAKGAFYDLWQAQNEFY